MHAAFLAWLAMMAGLSLSLAAQAQTDPEVSALNIQCRDALARGDYAKAEPPCTSAERLASRVEPNSVQHSTALFNLGALYTLSGEHTLAVSHFKHTLAIRKRELGADHPHTATTLASLGRAYASLKNYGAAKTYLSLALDARERILGPDHVAVAESLNDLGVVLYQLEEFILSEDLLKRALKIRQERLGPEHAETRATQANLGAAGLRASP